MKAATRTQDSKKAERAAIFRELVTQIDAGLKAEQATSQEGKYTAQLKRIAKTPALQGLQRYSPLNQLLILTQRPDATDTAGYVTWQERGYQVRKGEKAIYIIAPHEKTKQTEGDQEDSRSIGFHRTPVFDISQVDPITQDNQGEPQEQDAPADEGTAE